MLEDLYDCGFKSRLLENSRKVTFIYKTLKRRGFYLRGLLYLQENTLGKNEIKIIIL